MPHIFKNKNNNKLYTIELLVNDIYHLNRNAFAGIYAYPYKWKGEIITHTLGQKRMGEINFFNPHKFINDNFEIKEEII